MTAGTPVRALKIDRRRIRLQLIGAVLSVVVALTAALGMRDRVRLVDIVALFAGGMGAGVTIAMAAREARERRRQ